MTKVLVTITGAGLVLAGAAMLVLPGPGWLTIIGGLTILRREYAWAGRVLDYAHERVVAAWRWVRRSEHGVERVG